MENLFQKKRIELDYVRRSWLIDVYKIYAFCKKNKPLLWIFTIYAIIVGYILLSLRLLKSDLKFKKEMDVRSRMLRTDQRNTQADVERDKSNLGILSKRN
jgi:hypothetical protein